jgi:nitrate reductase gamma subunit
MFSFIGFVLPYITILVFILGMIYRIKMWTSLATPKMTLFPAPSPGGERFIEILKETFLFKSLFKGDKNLWAMGWLFHVMLLLIFIGHFRVFAWLPDRMLQTIGMTPENIDTMSLVSGGAAGIVILVSLFIILGRRFGVKRVRQISESGDYFALILILLIVLTGDVMRFVSHIDLAQTREYFQGLILFTLTPLPVNSWFIFHYLLAQILIMYIPFSKILHFGGIFFSEALVHKQ